MRTERPRHAWLSVLLVAAAACGETEGSNQPSRVPASFELTPAALVLPQLRSARLEIRVLDPEGEVIDGQVVTYTSGDASIATVSSVGVVTSPGPVGNTTIAIAAGSIDTVVPVEITAVAGTFEVTPERLAMAVGTRRQLSAVVRDAVGNPVHDAPVTYESSDPARVTVTPDGLVTYAGAGTAAIRVRTGDQLVVVPYRGLRSGHPLGVAMAPVLFRNDVAFGDRPFGVAVDQHGQVLVTLLSATSRPEIISRPTMTVFSSAARRPRW